MKNRYWTKSSCVCDFLDTWTKKYKVSMPGLTVIDASPKNISSPRWHTSETFPSRGKIFQERDEFVEYLDVIFAMGLKGTAVEVGLDQGGTHLGWLQIFSKVATIEIDINKCVKFLAISKPNIKRSSIFCADSADADTYKALSKKYRQVDMVFIDGDHQYSSVLCDYKCLSPLVRKGGLIGFHDTLGRHPSHLGVTKFIRKLRNGDVDGKKHTVYDIFRNGTGISYEVVE